jgi:hypothetical protein
MHRPCYETQSRVRLHREARAARRRAEGLGDSPLEYTDDSGCDSKSCGRQLGELLMLAVLSVPLIAFAHFNWHTQANSELGKS